MGAIFCFKIPITVEENAKSKGDVYQGGGVVADLVGQCVHVGDDDVVGRPANHQAGLWISSVGRRGITVCDGELEEEDDDDDGGATEHLELR